MHKPQVSDLQALVLCGAIHHPAYHSDVVGVHALQASLLGVAVVQVLKDGVGTPAGVAVGGRVVTEVALVATPHVVVPCTDDVHFLYLVLRGPSVPARRREQGR